MINQAEGQFGLLLDFTSYDDVSDDVWSLTALGVTFAEYEAFNGNDAITMGTQQLGATVKTVPKAYNGGTPADLTDDGYTVQVLNDGSLFINATPIPEPATMVLFGIGLLGIANLGRRKIEK